MSKSKKPAVGRPIWRLCVILLGVYTVMTLYLKDIGWAKNAVEAAVDASLELWKAEHVRWQKHLGTIALERRCHHPACVVFVSRSGDGEYEAQMKIEGEDAKTFLAILLAKTRPSVEYGRATEGGTHIYVQDRWGRWVACIEPSASSSIRVSILVEWLRAYAHTGSRLPIFEADHLKQQCSNLAISYRTAVE